MWGILMIHIYMEIKHECQTNITDTYGLFTRLGFMIHPKKSIRKPVQSLIFLGFVLNSVKMTVCLPNDKVFRIKEQCSKPIKHVSISIQEFAEVIGLLVSSFSGVLHGPLLYRHLEHDKTMALRHNKGNYQGRVKLSQEKALKNYNGGVIILSRLIILFVLRMPKLKSPCILIPQTKVGVLSWVLKKKEADGLRQNRKTTLTALS